MICNRQFGIWSADLILSVIILFLAILPFPMYPLTPLPVQTMINEQRVVKWNIHGHFHKNSSQNSTETLGNIDKYYDSNYYKAHKKHYFLVQIDDGLSPIALEDMMRVNSHE
jgi:hypothetical protein